MTNQIIAFLVGASPFAIGLAGRWLNQRETMKRVKSAYPAINVALSAIAGPYTKDDTVIGIIADAAYLFWQGQTPSTDKAQALTAETVKHWQRSKWLRSRGQLPQPAVTMGNKLATAIAESVEVKNDA